MLTELETDSRYMGNIEGGVLWSSSVIVMQHCTVVMDGDILFSRLQREIVLVRVGGGDGDVFSR
jgi:hypothetical protein